MIFITKDLFVRLVSFLRSPDVWRIKGVGQLVWDLFLSEDEEIELPQERLDILEYI